MRELQQEIIESLKVKPVINPQEEIRNTVNFLKNYLRKHSFLEGFVLGISGGQDSTLAGKLAQIAIDELNEEELMREYKFYAVRLPYGTQSDAEDAVAAIEFIGAKDAMCVDIKTAVDATVNSVEAHGIMINDFNKGNIKARQRMVVQYAIAGEKTCAVIGTDHAAESITGFYTKFGDGAADLLPLWRLNKRQGRELLAYLEAPEHLYTKIPTADLEEDKPLLPDEEALGVTYDEIDDYLEGKEVSPEASEKIEGWYVKTRHKRHLPITIYDKFWK